MPRRKQWFRLACMYPLELDQISVQNNSLCFLPVYSTAQDYNLV